MLWDDDELSPRCRAGEVERQSRSRLTETYGRLNQTLQPRSYVPILLYTVSSICQSFTNTRRSSWCHFFSFSSFFNTVLDLSIYRLLKCEYRVIESIGELILTQVLSKVNRSDLNRRHSSSSEESACCNCNQCKL